MNLMNRVCKPYMDKFVIVFIDDILSYSKDEKEHEEHLKAILELLKKEELLSLVIGSCISFEQSAFIKGRNILDGPLILNEVLVWYRKRKKELMVFKVDFEKAFDSLRWDYLDMVMGKLGFGLKSRSWIYRYLHNARSFILVNPEFDIYRAFDKGIPYLNFSSFWLWKVCTCLHVRQKRQASGLARTHTISYVATWPDAPTGMPLLNPLLPNLLFGKLACYLLAAMCGQESSSFPRLVFQSQKTSVWWVNLDRRGIDAGSIRCLVCQVDVETINHIFFSCDMAFVLWAKLARWWSLDIPICTIFLEWLEWIGSLHLPKKVKDILEGVGGILMYVLECRKMKGLMGFIGFKVLLVSLGIFIATCDANQPIEVHALSMFKEGIFDDPLLVLSSWNALDSDPCNWVGISCSGDQVTKLNISGSSITGFIARELFQLASLQELILRGNKLIGSIPKEIGLLKNLKILDLGMNQISGPIPHEIGNLVSIVIINLQSNGLTGQLPSELGNLKNLQELRLDRNKLRGGVPGANATGLVSNTQGMFAANATRLGFCRSASLKVADFSYNFLVGSIPKCLGYLPRKSFQGFKGTAYQ
nr:probable LRR receptor-like serine/threonine-protein kinase At1g63430 [Tanacetum cinerariifolium]